MENIIQLKQYPMEKLDHQDLIKKLQKLEFLVLKLNKLIQFQVQKTIRISNSDGIHFIDTNEIIHI